MLLLSPLIRHLWHFLFCFFMMCGICLSSSAAEQTIKGAISYHGSFLQGGLITAHLPDGAQASLDGEPLIISDHNWIAFGFHRDDSATQTLLITTTDGTNYTSIITPEARDYKTQSITGLAGKYVSPPQETLDRIASDRKKVSAARARISTNDNFITSGFEWPVTGPITGVYGSQRILNGKPRAPHYGIDIAAPKGTNVISPADGVITMADDLYYTGGTIIIDHGLAISSTLLHLEEMLVTVGDTVTKGMVIGTVGSTGRSTGPHLDWRINWGSKRLDPQLALSTP